MIYTHSVEEGKIKLSHVPVGEIKYIYSIVNGGVAARYAQSGAEGESVFSINEDDVETIIQPAHELIETIKEIINKTRLNA